MYTLEDILLKYLKPICEKLWLKHRKHYGGDREDVEQAASLALIEWSRTQPDPEKLIGWEPVAQVAAMAELKSLPRDSGSWLCSTWGEPENKGQLWWDNYLRFEDAEFARSVPALQQRKLTKAQQKLLKKFRNCVYKAVGDEVLTHVIWLRCGAGFSAEETAVLLSRLKYTRADPPTPERVEEWLREAKEKLRRNLNYKTKTVEGVMKLWQFKDELDGDVEDEGEDSSE